ncbi:MAG: hypothetical protein O2905_06555 [Proteobacteria bacterium]|nr:hypothetical protein [Pseudomonadota bacterium]
MSQTTAAIVAAPAAATDEHSTGSVPASARTPEPGAEFDPAQIYDLKRIARKYDLKKMTGPDAVRLASELVAAGFEESDALAVTLPISSRNLLDRIGRVGRAPRIEHWTDLMAYHVTQLESAHEMRAEPQRVDQLARLVVLAQTLSEAGA